MQSPSFRIKHFCFGEVVPVPNLESEVLGAFRRDVTKHEIIMGILGCEPDRLTTNFSTAMAKSAPRSQLVEERRRAGML